MESNTDPQPTSGPIAPQRPDVDLDHSDVERHVIAALRGIGYGAAEIAALVARPDTRVEILCLRCRNPFLSADRRANRLCETCTELVPDLAIEEDKFPYHATRSVRGAA